MMNLYNEPLKGKGAFTHCAISPPAPTNLSTTNSTALNFLWVLRKRQGFFLNYDDKVPTVIVSLCSIIFIRSHFHIAFLVEFKQPLQLTWKWWALMTSETAQALIDSLACCQSSAKSEFSVFCLPINRLHIFWFVSTLY